MAMQSVALNVRNMVGLSIAQVTIMLQQEAELLDDTWQRYSGQFEMAPVDDDIDEAHEMWCHVVEQ